jgi:hypothetical protein
MLITTGQTFKIHYQTRQPGEKVWMTPANPVPVCPVGDEIPELCFKRIFKATFGTSLEYRITAVESLFPL